jgi:hypothetical protein
VYDLSSFLFISLRCFLFVFRSAFVFVFIHYFIERTGVAVNSLGRFSVQSSAPTPIILTSVFRGFSQSLTYLPTELSPS